MRNPTWYLVLIKSLLYSIFLCARYDVTPPPSPTLIINLTVVTHPLISVMHLDAGKDSLSLHVTTKCVTNSYTLIDETYPQHMYAVNPPSTRATANQSIRYARGVTDCRKGLT